MFVDIDSFSFFTPIIAHLYAANHPYQSPKLIKTQVNTMVFTTAQSLYNAIKATDATIWEAVQNRDVVAILTQLHNSILVSTSFLLSDLLTNQNKSGIFHSDHTALFPEGFLERYFLFDCCREWMMAGKSGAMDTFLMKQ